MTSRNALKRDVERLFTELATALDRPAIDLAIQGPRMLFEHGEYQICAEELEMTIEAVVEPGSPATAVAQRILEALDRLRKSPAISPLADSAIEQARERLRRGPVAIEPGGRVHYYDVDRQMAAVADRLTAGVLADSLCFVIDLVKGDPSRVERGGSKVYGPPQLPAGWRMPAAWESVHFFLQLDLAEVCSHDIDNQLPAEGMLWFFLAPRGEDCRVHYDPHPTHLVCRDDVAALAGLERSLQPAPHYICYANDGDAYEYPRARDALGHQLRRELDEILGCSLTTWDTGFRLFGRPICWQGEDVGSTGNLLLLHAEHEDAALHFWADHTALKDGDTSGIYLSSSTT